MLRPGTISFLTDEAISVYVGGRFFRCFRPFLSWLTKGESYWFEYKGDQTYEVRSDNNLGKNFRMEGQQLLTCFIPRECENDEFEAIRYFHWLGELGISSAYVEDYIAYKKELYLKTAMLDCHTCAEYGNKCQPEDNVFICDYPMKDKYASEWHHI